MKSYEYPRVRPPTSLAPPQRPADNRFSWMDATADEEHRMWTNNTRKQTNTPTPALPPLSTQPTQVVLQQPLRMEVHTHNGEVHQYPGQDLGVTQQQQQHIQDPRYNGAYNTQQQYSQVQVPQTQMQPPEQTTSLPPQPPDPVKQPPVPAYEATAPIAPDENPLSPTTLKFNRGSTNMAIVPPPADPSQYSIGSFTPSPQAIRGGSWQHGLCSCAEPSTCLTGLFCPCIVYGRTQYRLTLRGERKDPTNMLGYTAVNGSCIAFGVLCGFNSILAAIQHTRIRKTYNMNSEAGNVAGDCLKGFCCCCCVVAQDEKEVRFREEQARKPAGSKKEGYVTPAAMNFSPRSP